MSLKRTSVEESSDSEFEVFKPRKNPDLSLPEDFCSSSSDMKFLVTGSWLPQLMAEKTPLIDFVINKTSSLFVWQFHIGNKKQNHLYEVWSRTNKINNTKATVNLTELDREKIPLNFNISVSCKQFPVFDLKLNFWDPGNDPNGITRTAANWDVSLTVESTGVDPNSVTHVVVEGGWEVRLLTP